MGFEMIEQKEVAFNWLDGNEEREMNEADVEHVKGLIREGYVEGELNQYDQEEEVEIRGWWRLAT